MASYGRIFAAAKTLLKSGFALATSGGIIGGGCYVTYQDKCRYHRIREEFGHGNIVGPAMEDEQFPYYSRPNLENMLLDVLRPSGDGKYYLIHGEVGTGKTKLLLELTRRLMKEEGKHGHGAPLYVLASHGINFPETLASAVRFYFDEHLSLSNFVDFALGIESFPKKGEHNKTQRVLNAIEKAAYAYKKKTGKCLVLIIDDITWIKEHNKGVLPKIQGKAKIWADANVAKVIFVCNDEETEEILYNNPGEWSRAAAPIEILDLTDAEAKEFLLAEFSHDDVSKHAVKGDNPIGQGNENSHEKENGHDDVSKQAVKGDNPIGQENENSQEKTNAPHISSKVCTKEISQEYIDKVVNLVGGRILYLLEFKRDFANGIPFEETAVRLKEKERTKFLRVSKTGTAWLVIERLQMTEGKTIELIELMGESSQADVMELAESNIIKWERNKDSIDVKFESRLVEIVVAEFCESLP